MKRACDEFTEHSYQSSYRSYKSLYDMLRSSENPGGFEDAILACFRMARCCLRCCSDEERKKSDPAAAEKVVAYQKRQLEKSEKVVEMAVRYASQSGLARVAEGKIRTEMEAMEQDLESLAHCQGVEEHVELVRRAFFGISQSTDKVGR